MARKRDKNRPIEQLRSTWTSTADLEETIAAMFLRSPEAAGSKDTVSDERVVTVSVGPIETVVVDQEPIVSVDSPDTVPGSKSDMVAGEPADTVAAPTSDQGTESSQNTSLTLSATVSEILSTTVADERQDTVSVGRIPADLWQAEGTGGLFASSRIRRISIAQDALTHSEESVYDTLWGPKNQNRDAYRLASLGYDAIAKTARVTKMNAKWIVERLIHKGFVKVEALPDPLRRIPTKYRVFSYRTALDNMARSNRFHVVRTGNGVLFAHPFKMTISVEPPATVSASSVPTISVGPGATAPHRQPDTVCPPQGATVAPVETLLDRNSETAATSNVVAAAIIRELGFVDDGALRTLIRKCRENATDATEEEIAELGAMTARRIIRMRNIENPTGLLIEQTAKCFVGQPFAIYRREKEEREARIRQLYES